MKGTQRHCCKAQNQVQTILSSYRAAVQVQRAPPVGEKSNSRLHLLKSSTHRQENNVEGRLVLFTISFKSQWKHFQTTLHHLSPLNFLLRQHD